MSITTIGDCWFPLLSSTFTAFNHKKRRSALNLLRSGHAGASSVSRASCLHSNLFFSPCLCTVSCFCIEHVVHAPLPDDWTGFSAAFVETLKGIVRLSFYGVRLPCCHALSLTCPLILVSHGMSVQPLIQAVLTMALRNISVVIVKPSSGGRRG